MSQQYCNALLRWKSTLQIVPLTWEAVERIVWRRGWEWGVAVIIHCNDNDHDNDNEKSVFNLCRSKLSLGAPGQEEK